jgi:hypothetical protein
MDLGGFGFLSSLHRGIEQAKRSETIAQEIAA